MINKKRLTVTASISSLKELDAIIKKEDVKISFLIQYLIDDFIVLYKGEEDETKER